MNYQHWFVIIITIIIQWLLLRDGFHAAYLVFHTSKFHFLMFSSMHVFRPEGQIWDPVRRDTKIYVR